MKQLSNLFENNRKWAGRITGEQPDFFRQLSRQQSPEYLWIGCSDSRVPANEIVGLLPGELFVHRNVANLIIHTDMNCLSVLQYAVEVLRVKHVIVCGHYGCGGVQSAIGQKSLGLIDNWLRHIRDIYLRERAQFVGIEREKDIVNRLCELNVRQQTINVCNTTVIQDAWRRGGEVSVHGWIYDISDGMLKDLDICVASDAELARIAGR